MPDPVAPSGPSSAPTASPAPAATPSASPAPAASAAPNPAPTATPSQPASPAAPQGRLSPQDVQAEMRRVAKDAIAKPQGQPSAPNNQGQPSPAPVTDPNAKDAEKKAGAEDDGQDDGQLPEIDENALPFDQRHIMRRWKRALDKTRAEVAKLQPAAEQYGKVMDYMHQFSLTPEQVAIGFDVMAKLNTNPQLAYQALKPIMDELEARIGEKLPPDLMKRIEMGLVDETTARELARQRGFTTTATELSNKQMQESQRMHAQQRQTAINGAVSAWEAQRNEKDPDFARKQPMVEDAARAIMAKEGIADTPDKAISVLNRALKLVEDRLSPFRVAGSPTLRQPQATGAPQINGATPEPQSMREAALQGLKGQYRFGA